MGTLTGTYTLPTGTPESGAITLRLTGRVVNASGPAHLHRGPDQRGPRRDGVVHCGPGRRRRPRLRRPRHRPRLRAGGTPVEPRRRRAPLHPAPRVLGRGSWRTWSGTTRHRIRPPNRSPDPPARRARRARSARSAPSAPRARRASPASRGAAASTATTGAAAATASDPGPGNVSIQSTGGQNRTIAISGTDATVSRATGRPLQPGDNFTVTDDPRDRADHRVRALHRNGHRRGPRRWHLVPGHRPAHRHQRHPTTTTGRDTAAGRRSTRRAHRPGADLQRPRRPAACPSPGSRWAIPGGGDVHRSTTAGQSRYWLRCGGSAHGDAVSRATGGHCVPDAALHFLTVPWDSGLQRNLRHSAAVV